jgi:hypothetical protein
MRNPWNGKRANPSHQPAPEGRRNCSARVQLIRNARRDRRVSVLGREDNVKEELRVDSRHFNSFAPLGRGVDDNPRLHGLRDHRLRRRFAPPVATVLRPVGAIREVHIIVFSKQCDSPVKPVGRRRLLATNFPSHRKILAHPWFKIPDSAMPNKNIIFSLNIARIHGIVF